MRKTATYKMVPKKYSPSKTVHEFMGTYKDRSNKINLPIIGASQPQSSENEVLQYPVPFVTGTLSTNSKTVISPFSQNREKDRSTSKCSTGYANAREMKKLRNMHKGLPKLKNKKS